MAGVAFVAYIFSIQQFDVQRKMAAPPELMVTLPLAAQVLFAGGDRYLAANLAGFRVLVASTERMESDDYKVQARLQQDVAWLNPGHEDNYYIAAAILPWSGEVAASQEILRRAGDARPYDWMPLFYYGFGRYHFYKDPAGGAKALLEAAPHARDEQDALSLRILALRWTEKGYSTATAAGVVDAMAQTSPPGAFQKYLGKRAERLRVLSQLREDVKRYESKTGKRATTLSDVQRSGVVERLPVDPFGIGFALDGNGVPVFREQLESQ